MIGYITLGTNDLKSSENFYGDLLECIGATRAYQTDTLIAWRFQGSAPLLVVNLPFDGGTATSGNGTMVALNVPDHETVDRLHARALELGAVDEGTPGPRGKGYYAAYFRDAWGNKLNVHSNS